MLYDDDDDEDDDDPLDYGIEDDPEYQRNVAANGPGLLVSSDQRVRTPKQHTTPCSDCPWRRKALNGWLGPHTIQEWLAYALSDMIIPCHVLTAPDGDSHQCAGAAIFRRNVCKLAREPNLRLEANKTTVFATPAEFTDHHSKLPEMPRGTAKIKKKTTAKKAVTDEQVGEQLARYNRLFDSWVAKSVIASKRVAVLRKKVQYYQTRQMAIQSRLAEEQAARIQLLREQAENTRPTRGLSVRTPRS